MKDLKEADYNREPVYYCSLCLSLGIKEVDGLDYCSNCGDTIIEKTTIYDWENKYELKYGYKYIIENKKNGRKKERS